ncbi:hypothetical protein PFISCL1PPCAC_9952 [Pristionchus fissidentatus]|uniref:26S proteasome non-ATPase regulatory subunit 5 n=1 Tax=Pristionchus fissidentatus TaxID=1538716 RepID=A0AAV5VJ59_9BILA|nr:hypothetical protein PFISCL1PPCAC_9952 [Pristionchus fissidentatus]
MEGLDEFRARAGAEETSVEWDAERFIQLQKELMSAGVEEAVKVLRQLGDIDLMRVEEGDFTLDMVADALRMALSKVDTQSLFMAAQPTLLRILSDGIPSSIKRKLIYRLKEDKAAAQTALGTVGLATAVALARNLPVEDLTKEICDLLAPLFTKTEIMGEYRDQLTRADERMAVYEALGESLAQGHFSTEMQPFFDEIEKDIKSSDFLMQMTSLDTLSNMIIKCTPEISKKLIDVFGGEVYALFESAKDAPDGGFVFEGAQKFLCEIASIHPSTLSTFSSLYPNLVNQVLNFSSLDALSRVRAFELFSLLSRSDEGKSTLLSPSLISSTSSCLSQFPLAIESSPIEMKTRLVQTLAFLFKEGSNENKQRFFMAIGPSFATTTVELARRPFTDLKGGVYELWMNLLDSPFGCSLLLGTPDFISWLLPYCGTSWTDSQAWRDICNALLQYPDIEPVMAERIKSAISEHDNPRAVPQVAMEI